MIIPDAAIGALGAAVLAAAVSVTSLIIGKENKTSEFRQAWIDALREELAGLLSASYTLNQLMSNDRREVTDEAYREAFDRFLVTRSMINLRLNHNEEECIELLDHASRIEDWLYHTYEDKNHSKDMKELHKIRKDFIKCANSVLKKEWDRVKMGERSFSLTKNISLAVGCAASALLLGLAIRAI